MSALVVWTWEWPAYLWMITNRKNPKRLPPSTSTIECIGSAPVKAMRDCTKPALAAGVTMPWIEAPKH